MFVLCVVVPYLVYFLVLYFMVKERESESWLLYFICILDVMWLLMFRISSSKKCCWLVCSVWLWDFLVVKTCFFKQVLPCLIDGAPDVISQALLGAPVWRKEQINGFVCNTQSDAKSCKV